MEGSVSGEAGWKGKPDQASQLKWPTSRDATQPQQWRSELDMGGAAAAWDCSSEKCTCLSEEETTSAAVRAKDLCEIRGGHHDWTLESYGALRKWSICAAHDKPPEGILQEDTCEQWSLAGRDFSGRISATV
jgi:hypothetical protein